MITLRNEVQIHRPVSEVFDFVANVENVPKWQPAVLETKRLTPGPTRVGTQFSEVAKLMGRRVEGVCEITELAPDQRFSFTGMPNAPFSYETVYAFEARGTHTQLKIVGTFRFKGAWRFFEPLIGLLIRLESAEELKAMRRAIEAAGERRLS
jgi:uncharacterized membrane protein